jgi:hypoxanthine phosphoribosyltransferase
MSFSPSPDVISDIVLTEQQIGQRVRELGQTISSDYAGCNPILVGVLRGVVLFMADLMRSITVPYTIDFLAISAYGAQRHGAVRILKDLEEDIAGRHVLVVEDMVDTGLTLHYLLRVLAERHPASLQVCAMFDKPRLRLIDLPLTYVGFTLPDRYVVGYGLDYRQRYRNLPFVGTLSAKILLRDEEGIHHET